MGIILIVSMAIGFLLVFLTMIDVEFYGFDTKRAITAIVGVLMFIVPIVLFFSFQPKKEIALYDNYEIYALQDNISINGSGGLFYHYIDSELNYHVRKDYKDGKIIVELKGDDVYLVESDCVANVKIYKEKRTTNLWLWSEWGKIIDIRVEIPKNSNNKQFESDMK